MAYLETYLNLRTKLLQDFDINDLNFVTELELVGYINEAIRDSETLIHNMGWEDKYFLTKTTFSWVAGTASYSLPANLYGLKIRLIQYANGASVYPITRITRLEEIPFILSSDLYQYIITNDPVLSYQATFYPPIAETSNNATLWYVRQMNQMTTSQLSSNVCEIPQCANFVYSHVKWNLQKKTRRADLVADAKADRDTEYQLMAETLKDMTQEENNLAMQDLSSYFEQEFGMR